MNAEDRKMFDKLFDRLESISHEVYEIKASQLGLSSGMTEKMRSIETSIFDLGKHRSDIDKRVRKIETSVTVFMSVVTFAWAIIRFIGPQILKAFRG